MTSFSITGNDNLSNHLPERTASIAAPGMLAATRRPCRYTRIPLHDDPRGIRRIRSLKFLISFNPLTEFMNLPNQRQMSVEKMDDLTDQKSGDDRSDSETPDFSEKQERQNDCRQNQ